MEFQGNKSVSAPAVTGGTESGLPEGNQWRYSEFINAVQSGKVERVRFAKDGTQLQLTAVDGGWLRWARQSSPTCFAVRSCNMRICTHGACSRCHSCAKR